MITDFSFSYRFFSSSFEQHTSVKNLPERFLIGLEGCASLTLDLRNNALQTIGPQSIRNNNSLSITSTRHLSGIPIFYYLNNGVKII